MPVTSDSCSLTGRWRRTTRYVLLAASCCWLVMTVGGPARATVVERVVAVVGEHAILLSDLRARARPFLLRVHRDYPPGAQRTAATSQIYGMLLQRMVNEELLQRAATKAKVTVTPAEIDQAIARVAAQNGLSVERILVEATRSGMTEKEYRREIRRQVLDVKLMNLRLQGRLRITADDLRAHYRQLVTAERRKLPFRAAWIVIRVARDAAAKEVERQRQRAEWILARARGGASFAELARQYSDDPKTAEAGGLLGRLKFGSLPASVDQALLGLEVGETGGPLRSDQGFVVVRLLERGSSDLPAFEEAAEELQQRVYLEKLDQARGQWLESLRRQTHVEVRL